MSSTTSRRLRASTLLAVALVTALLLSGCARTVPDRFDKGREEFDAAAKLVLNQAETLPPKAERAHLYGLPAQQRDLTVDGQAWFVRVDGANFVFFPMSVEEPNFYMGYVYSQSGSEPEGVFTGDDMKPLANGWWYGGFSERWLAGAD